jgi:hypothetical protein
LKDFFGGGWEDGAYFRGFFGGVFFGLFGMYFFEMTLGFLKWVFGFFRN